MITDEERREVARRLRKLDYDDLRESLICAYLDALGIEGYENWVGIAHRLADLIDPTPKSSESAPKCDREALLELADEMEAEVLISGVSASRNCVLEYVKRIRKLCWK